MPPAFLNDLRGLLFDLDGVIYTGARAIPGASELLAEARRRQMPFLLVTNNSTRSAAAVAGALARMGIHVAPEEILTSSAAAAGFVREHAGPSARVLVIGEAGLREAVADAGLQVVEDEAADWVVAGLFRQFDYAWLTRAVRAILNGARFVATNADALLPVEGGAYLPGAGSIVGSIAIATGVQPTVIGKPEPVLFRQGVERLGSPPPARVAMIGDRLDTDIHGAARAGLSTILVLTGISTAAEAETSTPRPDLVLPDLPALARLLGWT